MKLDCQLPASLNAFEMVFEGVEYLVIEKSALAGLYGPVVIGHVAAEETKGPKARRKKAAHSNGAPPVPAPQQAPPAEGINQASYQYQVKAFLRARPLESADLIRQFGPKVPPSSVYSALAALRNAGTVVMKVDEASGRRLNFLQEGAA